MKVKQGDKKKKFCFYVTWISFPLRVKQSSLQIHECPLAEREFLNWRRSGNWRSNPVGTGGI